jgi:hypothetical protein
MPAFLTAEWKNLVMANYIVSPALLQPYLPAGTELDYLDGNCYASLVGFMFCNTKIMGVRIPFHVNFEEVNLRFYVRYNDQGNWKRGTVFIKEIVPKAAISFVANNIYHEKYHTMRMSHTDEETADAFNFLYRWKYHSNWNSLEAMTGKTAVPMLPGSKEAFIAEHYWGYSKYSDSKTFEYEVQHPSWEIYPVKKYSINCDFASLYGNEFSALNEATPDCVFVAKGSAVSVLKKRNL